MVASFALDNLFIFSAGALPAPLWKRMAPSCSAIDKLSPANGRHSGSSEGCDEFETTLDALLNFALDAAWQAGRVTLAYFQTGLVAERKTDNSPVTIADREAEQKLRRLSSKHGGRSPLSAGSARSPGMPATPLLLDHRSHRRQNRSSGGVPLTLCCSLWLGQRAIAGRNAFPRTKRNGLCGARGMPTGTTAGSMSPRFLACPMPSCWPATSTRLHMPNSAGAPASGA